MPVDVPLGNGVGDPLIAEHPHQPIEDSRGVMVLDCSDEASFDCVMPQIVDASNLTGNGAHLANKRAGVLHSFGVGRNGGM